MHKKNNNTIVFNGQGECRINGRVYYYDADYEQGVLTLEMDNEFRKEEVVLDLERYVDDWDLKVGYHGDQEYVIDDDDFSLSTWEIADLILFCLDSNGEFVQKYNYLIQCKQYNRHELETAWYRQRFLQIANAVLRKRFPFKKQRNAYCALLWKRHYGSWK